MGGYPQDITATDPLDPRTNLNPSTTAAPSYAAASLFLYKQLTGDDSLNGKIDGVETPRKYASDFFKPSRFDSNFRSTGIISYIADPFGFSFGYSTAGLKQEQDYRVALEASPTATRPVSPNIKGFNPTFDLWSTAGSTGPKSGNTDDAKELERKKWIKNW
jgi:hypothetical protein